MLLTLQLALVGQLTVAPGRTTALRRLETASLIASFGTVLGALSLSLGGGDDDAAAAADSAGPDQPAVGGEAAALQQLVVSVSILGLHGFVGLGALQVRRGVARTRAPHLSPSRCPCMCSKLLGTCCLSVPLP